MKALTNLFENNQHWIASKTEKDPSFFSNMAGDQVPLYLWIGCADSRVPANEIVGLEPGELFVHRNVANLCLHTDMNCLSVLEFAVDLLQIPHIIICGHYNCGGVKAAMTDHKLGLVDNWLRNIRDVYSIYRKELDQIQDSKRRYNRLVELNVLHQLKNVCHTTIVQGAWHRNQSLTVHGWVYDLETGKLKDLGTSLSSIEEVDTIYRIQNET